MTYNENMSEIFKILGNPKRLHLLSLISEKEHTVGALSKILGTVPSETSWSLKILRDAGLVQKRIDRQMRHYSITDFGMKICRAIELLDKN